MTATKVAGVAYISALKGLSFTLTQLFYKTRAELKRLQQVLGLRDEDTVKIEASHKRKLNLGNQFIGILSLGIISFAVAWYIKPDKECPPCKLPPIKITNKFAEVCNIPKGKFNYGGSTSWSFIYPTSESKIKKTHPQFEINIRKDLVQGSGIGIEKLIDGELDFALSSRDVSSEEKDEAGKKHFSLKAIPVVKSGVAVAVNPKLEINSLTKDQVSEIYSGKIDNWRQAGAPADIPIKLYIRSRNSASTDEFRKTLNIVSFGKNINYVDTTNEALQEITKEPGGIFVGPISNIVPQCRVKTLPIINKGKTFYPYRDKEFVPPAQCRPGKRNKVNIEAINSDEYPFPVRFYVVVKENGQKEQQAGEAYANLLQTEQAKNMIRQLQETGGLDKNK
ncbi:MAG: substrate-binding domain-containing protein [Dolichospermum sp. DET50]|nr:substrate-binding domain-containing protein [Dolichospermum sp. DET66]MBS3032978.1 substrate-binding domain-containing protein [Dolichospermum sp. DET67]MBS3038183.1 substrate-binding domain-containing protein [Dolichospermum sp. DET50]QSX70084.1 MAG: substrate-binding domain-containing protein [Dolichospermum sp. DET69]